MGSVENFHETPSGSAGGTGEIFEAYEEEENKDLNTAYEADKKAMGGASFGVRFTMSAPSQPYMPSWSAQNAPKEQEVKLKNGKVMLAISGLTEPPPQKSTAELLKMSPA